MKPKYLELQLDLQSKILRGEYRPGDMIPSERELIEQYGMSRITVRRAIAELIASGYLTSTRGKGTFVQRLDMALNLSRLYSCTEELLRLGLVVTRQILNAEVVSASEKDIKKLDCNVNEPVYLLSYVLSGNGTPLIHKRSRLNYMLFPGFDGHWIGQEELYAVLKVKYGLRLTRASRSVKAECASEDIAELLHVKLGSPVVRFDGVTRGEIDGAEVVFETYTSWYRTDQLSFMIDQEYIEE